MKYFVRTIFCLLMLLLFTTLAFHTNFMKNYLRNKYASQFTIEEMNIYFPFSLSMKGVETQYEGHTIHAERIRASILPWCQFHLDELSIDNSLPLYLTGTGSLKRVTLSISDQPSFIRTLKVKAKLRQRDAAIQGPITFSYTSPEFEAHAKSYFRWAETMTLSDVSGDVKEVPFCANLELLADGTFHNSFLSIDNEQVTAELTGALTAPRLNVNGSLPYCDLKGDLAYESSILHGFFELTQDVYNAQLEIDWSKVNPLTFSLNQLTGPDTLLKGKAVLDNQMNLYGSLEGKIAQIHLSDSLSFGPTRGSFSFSPTQQLHGNLSCENLKWGAMRATQLHLDAAPGNIKLTGAEFSAKKAIFHALNLDMVHEPNVDEWHYTLSAKNAPLHSQGTLSPAHCTITHFRALVDQTPIHLDRPITISKNEISPLLMTIGDGHFDIDFDPLSLKLADVPLEVISWFYPELGISGLCSGEVSPQNGHFTFQKIHFKEKVLHQIADWNGDMQLQFHGDSIAFSAEVNELDETPITISGQLPFYTSQSLNKQMRISLKYHGEVSPFLHFFPVDSSTLQGKLNVNLNIAGTPLNPIVRGFGELYEGRFESIWSGAVFREIQGRIVANGKQIQLESLTGKNGKHGTFVGSGHLEFKPEEHYPFEVNLSTTKGKLFKLDHVQASVTGDVKLAGDLHHGELSGTLTSDKVAVKLPEQESSSVYHLPVTYINQQHTEAPPTQITTSKSSWPLHLNLQLKVPGGGEIRGGELHSVWQGEALLGGTAQDPTLKGAVKLVSGELQFNGSPLPMTEGTISFNGGLIKGTTMYVVSALEIDPATVEVILKGPLDDPYFSLRSNPPLPSREILSWILFGEGATGIDRLQKEELTKSIGELSRGSGSPDLLTKIRTKTGIDRIDILRGATADDVSLQVGKYISDGLLISVNKSITSDVNKVGVEAKLKNNFKIEAEISNTSDNQLFLKWKKNY